MSSARSDVELIGLAWDLLRDLGVSGLKLQINSIGTLEDRQKFRQQLVNWLEARADQLDADSQQRLTTNPLRIFNSKNSTAQALLADAPTLLDALSEDIAQRFEDVRGCLNQLANSVSA